MRCMKRQRKERKDLPELDSHEEHDVTGTRDEEYLHEGVVERDIRREQVEIPFRASSSARTRRGTHGGRGAIRDSTE